MARIFVGVTGGIAAYKACELVRLLVRAGHDVTPITTEGAERFVAAQTFWALARKRPPADPYPHLATADVLVVAPLTANTLARLAHGLADDLLTETALAHRGPLVLAPAMNTAMWEHPATRANLALLVERGAAVVGPEAGELAEGLVGTGRMAEPEQIAQRIEALLTSPVETSAFAAKHVLVTAGGTREPLDQVRFVGNRSSGKMGVALAEAAQERGARVTLLAATRHERARLDAIVKGRMPLQERIVDRLRSAGCEAGDVSVTIVYAAVRTEGWRHPQFHLELDHVAHATRTHAGHHAPGLELAVTKGAAEKRTYALRAARSEADGDEDGAGERRTGGETLRRP